MNIDNKWIGYCTNVHAGSDLEEMKANLENHACTVKRNCAPESPMGIGLWFSDQSAIDLISQDKIDKLGEWLNANELIPFTLNGFPFGNFHQEQVKHRVYLPSWAEDSRREYSERLAQIQHQLLPDGMEGSISTLPLAWGNHDVDDDFLSRCAGQLHELAEFLADLEERTGRLIYFCIEPEPGCVIQTSNSCIDFFEQHLFGESTSSDEMVRRHLRVCHDICHSAVMFEDQQEFIQNIVSAGIGIGKVQVSSAVHANFENSFGYTPLEILNQLSEFNEQRYLHQTVLKNKEGKTQFYQDLPEALTELQNRIDNYTEARVHFHVPIFLKEFGALTTSQTEILQCLEATQSIDDLTHFEAETYAWNVLPTALKKDSLADGISEEIKWLTHLANDSI
ncbi:MAG: metabolite traffic protein EboE [Planctomycetota bacterium]|nr:metabolite traffic protein EboE [Planctomycetota bacterium]